MRMIWLLQVIEALLQYEILAGYIRTVAAGENNFELWSLAPEFFRQFTATHPVRHDQIRQEEVYLVLASIPKLQSFRS